jgi:Tfp pilus assembly protein FimT
MSGSVSLAEMLVLTAIVAVIGAIVYRVIVSLGRR